MVWFRQLTGPNLWLCVWRWTLLHVSVHLSVFGLIVPACCRVLLLWPRVLNVLGLIVPTMTCGNPFLSLWRFLVVILLRLWKCRPMKTLPWLWMLLRAGSYKAMLVLTRRLVLPTWTDRRTFGCFGAKAVHCNDMIGRQVRSHIVEVAQLWNDVAKPAQPEVDERAKRRGKVPVKEWPQVGVLSRSTDGSSFRCFIFWSFAAVVQSGVAQQFFGDLDLFCSTLRFISTSTTWGGGGEVSRQMGCFQWDAGDDATTICIFSSLQMVSHFSAATSEILWSEVSNV